MRKTKSQIIHNAFIRSLPVLFGYLFLGSAFGILLQQAGYSFVWAFFISVIVYAGSMQFVLVSLLVTAATPMTTLMMTLFVNSRHIFYGLSLINEFKQMGKRYPYMIFSLTDETYSVLCGCKDDAVLNQCHPDDRRMIYFFIALFHQSYWILGCVTGALIGQLIPFDFTGIDFSMTALFVILLIEQILDKNAPKYIYASIGLLIALIFLFIFGSENFLLPTLIVSVLTIGIFEKTQETAHKKEDAIK